MWSHSGAGLENNTFIVGKAGDEFSFGPWGAKKDWRLAYRIITIALSETAIGPGTPNVFANDLDNALYVGNNAITPLVIKIMTEVVAGAISMYLTSTDLRAQLVSLAQIKRYEGNPPRGFLNTLTRGELGRNPAVMGYAWIGWSTVAHAVSIWQEIMQEFLKDLGATYNIPYNTMRAGLSKVIESWMMPGNNWARGAGIQWTAARLNPYFGSASVIPNNISHHLRLSNTEMEEVIVQIGQIPSKPYYVKQQILSTMLNGV
jgi:hypothetical protein